jgi:predicted nucleic acid-binding protein
MSPPSYRAVVDASVAAQLYVPEPLTAQAVALFRLLADPGTVFLVPDLFYVECANIFWKKVQRGDCTAAEATGALANIRALRLLPTPTFDLVADALPLAIAHGISAYDACYVTLAHRAGISLITADQRLVQKLTGTPYTVGWLGNWTPPSSPAPVP